MITKKNFILLWFTTSLLLISVTFFFLESQATELKLGHNASPLSTTHKAAIKFAELVKQKTSGKVAVAVYPAAQLGKPPELLQSVSMGTVDIFLEAMGWYSNVEKDFNLHNLPFVVKDSDHLMRILKSPVGQELLEKVRIKAGIVTLSYGGLRTPRNLLSKKPVNAISDLKGLKLRVPEVKSYIEAWKTLGTSPTPISWSEVYLALGQGIVDAVEGSLTDLYHSKFHELAKYCSLLEYKPVYVVFAINQKKFLSFSPEVQKGLKEAAEEGGEYLTKVEIEDVSVVRTKMKEAGVTFINIDVEPLIKKLEGFPERLEKEGNWSKGLYERWKSVQ